jgi:hypothetical protein
MGRNSRTNRSNLGMRTNAKHLAIHKKEDKLSFSNYRGISLVHVRYKVFTNILHRRLVPYTGESLGHYQCGLRKGRSSTDYLY